MKFEKLNLEKFEKIEKEQMGQLVGGEQVCGYDKTESGSYDNGDGTYCTYSSDWSTTTTDSNGNSSTSYLQICGSDMSEYQLRKHLNCWATPKF